MVLIIRKNDIKIIAADEKFQSSYRILLKYVNYIVYNNSLTIVSIHTVKGQVSYWINDVIIEVDDVMVEVDNREEEFIKYFINTDNLFSVFKYVDDGNINLKLNFIDSEKELLLTPSREIFSHINI